MQIMPEPFDKHPHQPSYHEQHSCNSFITVMFQSESFKIAANDQYNKLHKSISKFLPTPEVSAITRMVQTGKWWLIILFVITLFNSCREGKNEILTPEERNWLASQDNITFVHDKSFAPVDFIGNEGVQKGITSDIQKLIEERINYQFISVNKDSWSEMINSVKYRENDIIANIQNTEERQQFLKFTSPYISIPNVIIVNKNAEDELTLSDLSDKKVAIVEDYATINFSKTINPNIQIVEVKDNIKGLQMIAFNQVDALIVDIAIASYYIETLGISNLKIAGNINYDWNLCIATNKDAEMLHSILQKGLDAISQDEIKAIYSKWIHLEITPFYKTKEFWFTILSLILISVIIIITILLWNKTLKQKVKQKTRELIKAKEKAEESDKLKTEFIRNMSHEIRTPMNGIVGFTQFLSNNNLNNEEKEEYISIIQNSGNQLLRIINDILEISKLATNQVTATEQEICLNKLLHELLSVFEITAKRNKLPLLLKKKLTDTESTIYTDETKLNKILSNLLENALKYTPKGFVELGYYVKWDAKPLQLIIYVKDTGIGVSRDNQSSIFSSFYQENKELSKNLGGLGLGLSIAQENAKLLGGKISIRSKKGKGSTFSITLPYKPANTSIKKRVQNKPIEISAKKKTNIYNVLIIEDEDMNYLYLKILLKDKIKLNCNILQARNGREAIEVCKKHNNISIAFMDLKMPIMSGFEATKRIRKIRPELSIIAQTAYITKEDKERAFSAGCDAFISKPINVETLTEILNKYLN